MVLGATGLILLIACLNIANMQLARAIARRKEIGVRLCLGASRWRLIRQLLTESLVLSVVGGIAGVMLAWWSFNLFLSVVFVRYAGPEMERIAIDLTPDWFSVGYSLELSGYDAERAKVFQQQLMTRLAALPAVKSVSLHREFVGSGIITLLDQGGTGPKRFSGVPIEEIPSTFSRNDWYAARSWACVYN